MAVQRVMGISFSEVQKRCNFIFMAKVKKKRASKYDEKLAINASFEDVIKISVAGNPAPKPKPAKPLKKKK
jgi:hypothetical protein